MATYIMNAGCGGGCVTGPCPSPCSVPVITSSLTATGTIGAAFSYTITANNSPTSFDADDLPIGLSINTATGEISGTPTSISTTNVPIRATNACGTDSETLVITISGVACGIDFSDTILTTSFQSSTKCLENGSSPPCDPVAASTLHTYLDVITGSTGRLRVYVDGVNVYDSGVQSVGSEVFDTVSISSGAEEVYVTIDQTGSSQASFYRIHC